jgi:hypothetical protein
MTRTLRTEQKPFLTILGTRMRARDLETALIEDLKTTEKHGGWNKRTR